MLKDLKHHGIAVELKLKLALQSKANDKGFTEKQIVAIGIRDAKF